MASEDFTQPKPYTQTPINFHDVFSYEEETGRLLWKIKRRGRSSRKIGEEAGTISSMGYRIVEVYGKKYTAHRVIWKMVYGEIQGNLCIDHVDGNKENNRISNLRLTTLSINQRNSRIPKNNKTGVIGVHTHKYGYVISTPLKKGKLFYKDFFEACCARKSYEDKNDFHQNHGRRIA